MKNLKNKVKELEGLWLVLGFTTAMVGMIGTCGYLAGEILDESRHFNENEGKEIIYENDAKFINDGNGWRARAYQERQDYIHEQSNKK